MEIIGQPIDYGTAESKLVIITAEEGEFLIQCGGLSFHDLALDVDRSRQYPGYTPRYEFEIHRRFFAPSDEPWTLKKRPTKLDEGLPEYLKNYRQTLTVEKALEFEAGEEEEDNPNMGWVINGKWEYRKGGIVPRPKGI